MSPFIPCFLPRQAAPKIDSPDPPGANPAPPPFASCIARRGSVHLKDDIDINFIYQCICVYNIYITPPPPGPTLSFFWWYTMYIYIIYISHLYLHLYLYLYLGLYLYLFIYINVIVHIYIYIYVYVLEIGNTMIILGWFPLHLASENSDVVMWSLLFTQINYLSELYKKKRYRGTHAWWW